MVSPLDDVALLAPQLAADDLDPRAAQADAGADRGDVALGGGHRDPGALAGLPGGGLADHDAFLDLRDLGLEEPGEIARVRARQRDLRPLGAAPDLEHEGADAIAGVVAPAGNLRA